MDLAQKVSAKQLKSDIPEFRVGDTVRVDVKIIEGKKERIQAFEGVVTSRKGAGISDRIFEKKLIAYNHACRLLEPPLRAAQT